MKAKTMQVERFALIKTPFPFWARAASADIAYCSPTVHGCHDKPESLVLLTCSDSGIESP